VVLASNRGHYSLKTRQLVEWCLSICVFAYGKPTVFELSASYGFGLVKNHPFIDGNKRVGFIVAALFLELNGYRFQATEAGAVVRTLALAAGEMSEAEFAAWLKANSRRGS
jgi:death on curing protein